MVAVTRERRYGPSRLRVNDDDDDDLFSTVNELNYLYIRTYHTTLQTFNDPYSGTTRVSRYRKGKTNLDFTELNQSIISLLTYDKTHMLTLNTELQYKKSQ